MQIFLVLRTVGGSTPFFVSTLQELRTIIVLRTLFLGTFIFFEALLRSERVQCFKGLLFVGSSVYKDLLRTRDSRTVFKSPIFTSHFLGNLVLGFICSQGSVTFSC